MPVIVQPLTSQSALIPFHRTNTQYWDSNAARNFKAFGYCYPELVDWDVPGVSREQLKAKVANSVKNLYGNRTTTGTLAGITNKVLGGSGPFTTLASVPPTGSIPPAEKKPSQEHRHAAQNPLQAAANKVAEASRAAGTSFGNA